MAAIGSLQHIFEKPLPENSSLLEALSPWNQIKPVKPVDQNSFVEVFGELHFKESCDKSSSSSSSSFPMSSFTTSPVNSFLELIPQHNDDNSKKLDSFSSTPDIKYTGSHKKSDSFSSMNSESLQLCTEGLGFESSGDVEELKNEMDEDWQNQEERVSNFTTSKHYSPTEYHPYGEFRRSRTCSEAFPPPISCIGQSGKPWVCFKSFRHDGRFVLKEVRIPSREVLHAHREDGRLKLQFIQPKDELEEEEEDVHDEDEELEDAEVDEHEENEG